MSIRTSHPRIVEKPHPVKQGLKLRNMFESRVSEEVEKPHPVKQGLKPVCDVNADHISIVEKPHPVKQGLKHSAQTVAKWAVYRRETSSSKTRIETPLSRRHCRP